MLGNGTNNGWMCVCSYLPSDVLIFRLRYHVMTGCFTDESVVDLNQRGKAVMKRLGVPMVPSYEITMDQYWATVQTDGRWVHGMI